MNSKGNEQQPAAAQGIDLATAWAEGYRSGVMDERISESNIGIAGFGAKIEPARANPYMIDASPKGGSDARLRTMVVTLAPLWRLSDSWLEASDSPSDKHRAMWGCAKELRDKLVQMQTQAGDVEVQP